MPLPMHTLGFKLIQQVIKLAMEVAHHSPVYSIYRCMHSTYTLLCMVCIRVCVFACINMYMCVRVSVCLCIFIDQHGYESACACMKTLRYIILCS